MKSLSSMFAECLGLKVKGRHLHLASLLIAFMALFVSSAWAQEATIVGTVTDPSGAVIANAKVTATNSETGVVRSITSNEAGQYVLPDVHIGNYNVTAEAPGLKIAERKVSCCR